MLHHHPIDSPGKRRMEPIAVLVLAVIMSMASAVVIMVSIQQIQNYASDEDAEGPEVDVLTVVIVCVTIGELISHWLRTRSRFCLGV